MSNDLDLILRLVPEVIGPPHGAVIMAAAYSSKARVVIAEGLTMEQYLKLQETIFDTMCNCNCNDTQQCRREPTIEEHVRDLSKRLTDLTSRLFALENTVNTKKTDPIAMWDKIPLPDGSVGIVVEVRDSALLIRRQP